MLRPAQQLHGKVPHFCRFLVAVIVYPELHSTVKTYGKVPLTYSLILWLLLFIQYYPQQFSVWKGASFFCVWLMLIQNQLH